MQNVEQICKYFHLPANLPNGILFIIGPDFFGSDHAIFPILVNTTVGLTLFVLMP